jgi:hypothetical protein
MEKREPLMEVKEKNTAIIIKEFTKDGVIFQVNSIGEIKGKDYHANHIETSDNVLKMDGTMEWESRAMDATKEGDAVLITGKGTGRPEKPMEMRIKGELTFMTNSPRLSWLNNMKASVEAIVDQKNGELSGKMYTMITEAAPQVAAPAM